jgi:hypothetical protein
MYSVRKEDMSRDLLSSSRFSRDGRRCGLKIVKIAVSSPNDYISNSSKYLVNKPCTTSCTGQE